MSPRSRFVGTNSRPNVKPFHDTFPRARRCKTSWTFAHFPWRFLAAIHPWWIIILWLTSRRLDQSFLLGLPSGQIAHPGYATLPTLDTQIKFPPINTQLRRHPTHLIYSMYMTSFSYPTPKRLYDLPVLNPPNYWTHSTRSPYQTNSSSSTSPNGTALPDWPNKPWLARPTRLIKFSWLIPNLPVTEGIWVIRFKWFLWANQLLRDLSIPDFDLLRF